MKVGLSLMKNVLTSLAKSVLIPLGLSAAAATDATLQKKFHGLGINNCKGRNKRQENN